jgi:RNA polymerase sigma-70 factor (ECF subfamily)
MDDRGAASLRRHYGIVHRYVRRRASSREEAEDLTQDVFEAAIVALGQARLDAGGAPLAWLYTVARHRLIDRLRTARECASTQDPESLPSPDGGRAYGPAIVQALVDGLHGLSDEQRRVVLLKLFQGRTFAEIAAEVGASEEACRMRFSRGLFALRRHLQEKGIEP